MSHDRCLFENVAEQAADRFTGLEALFDPWTRSRLERVGVGLGWRCLEIGGGGGSIARWLAERVGATGQVLVTDIDPRHLAALADRGLPNLEVRQHDIVADPLEEGAFDLIHERLVLIHLAEREAVPRKLVAALRPGGWLVVEDFASRLLRRSWPVGAPDDAALFDKAFPALGTLLASRGADVTWAQRAHHAPRALGLVDIGADGYFAVARGGHGGHARRSRQVRADARRGGASQVADRRRDRSHPDPDRRPHFAIVTNAPITT